MLELPIFFVDAFADKLFEGNPAAVCLLPAAITDQSMQQLASEFNLSETAFVQYLDYGKFNLRWFTPKQEVNLCGHATLASAFIMFEEGLIEENDTIVFETLSGKIEVSKNKGAIQMDFPLVNTVAKKHAFFKEDFFGKPIVGSAWLKHNFILELENKEAVIQANPDQKVLAANSEEGIIITSWSENGDFDIFSRYFAPNLGIPEDPVTGFAHSALMDYFGRKKGVDKLSAFQASPRGGKMKIEQNGDRVWIIGRAVKVFESFIDVPAAVTFIE
ncbi:PhzF family phenazine biosynthesis protein [Pararhodonellum marinum]|uniref:PhzF family phenazine biosynthesis protein n=1 Tax=Pararhodonellum marinum TaxID=2755358 RepID=UPI001E53DE13|nr:PhzF family phenazine biosynthesis isomerase [Pararhodonellum marinum]